MYFVTYEYIYIGRIPLFKQPDNCETEMLQMDTSLSSVIEDDPKNMSHSQVQAQPPVQVPQKSKGSGIKENGL